MENETKTVVDHIVDMEWVMFTSVHNEGGRASCQDNRPFFYAMRYAQFSVWPEDAMDSYLMDLFAAHEQGRNLISEKYARMMESTAPAEYEALKDRLPPVTDTARRLAAKIVETYLGWMVESIKLYPYAAQGARTLYTRDDSATATSYETYLRCELLCMSEATLNLYSKYVARCAVDGPNLALATLDHIAQQNGFRDAEHMNLEQEIAATKRCCPRGME